MVDIRWPGQSTEIRRERGEILSFTKFINFTFGLTRNGLIWPIFGLFKLKVGLVEVSKLSAKYLANEMYD